MGELGLLREDEVERPGPGRQPDPRDLERRGAVPPLPRDLNGHRRLTEDDVARLRQLIYSPRDWIRDSPEGRARIAEEVERLRRRGALQEISDLRRWAAGNGIVWPDADE